MYVLKNRDSYIDNNFQITDDINKAKRFYDSYVYSLVEAVGLIPSEWLNELGLKMEEGLQIIKLKP